MKKDVLVFIANVDSVSTDPRNAGTLFKFVLIRINGEHRTAIGHKDWEDLREFLKNMYTEKRTLDYANQLFNTKQNKTKYQSG
jgi:hypothetical protein